MEVSYLNRLRGRFDRKGRLKCFLDEGAGGGASSVYELPGP